jgi:hypothetical protein
LPLRVAEIAASKAKGRNPPNAHTDEEAVDKESRASELQLKQGEFDALPKWRLQPSPRCKQPQQWFRLEHQEGRALGAFICLSPDPAPLEFQPVEFERQPGRQGCCLQQEAPT